MRPHKGASGDRIFWVDLIRVLALFSVVLLHVATVPAERFGQIPETWWWAANFYFSLAAPCVPLFVMISGALLLDPSRSQPLPYFIRRRVTRVVVPLLGWSIIYGAWRIFGRGESLTLWQFGHHLLAGLGNPVVIHLWFMYLILSLYLVTPIFWIYVRHASVENQLYFAGLWFFATGIQPVLRDYLGLTIGLTLEPVTGFIGYFLLGWTLRSILENERQGKLAAAAIVAFIAGYTVAVLGTWWFSERKGELDQYFYSEDSLNVIVMSISAFLLLRELGLALKRKTRLLGWIETASKLGLGAYLVHALLLELFARSSFGFIFNGTGIHSAVAIPLVAIVAFAASLLVCWILRGIPGARILVP